MPGADLKICFHGRDAVGKKLSRAHSKADLLSLEAIRLKQSCAQIYLYLPRFQEYAVHITGPQVYLALLQRTARWQPQIDSIVRSFPPVSEMVLHLIFNGQLTPSALILYGIMRSVGIAVHKEPYMLIL